MGHSEASYKGHHNSLENHGHYAMSITRQSGEALAICKNLLVCIFWIRFRVLLVPLRVHQPLHEILGTPGVQVLAVVTGERALRMALVLIHQIRIIEWVCLGNWEGAGKHSELVQLNLSFKGTCT